MIDSPVKAACAGMLLLASSASGRQLDASPEGWSLHEYVQTTWTHADGAPLADAWSLTQSTDGYLWFIVDDALVRFDGVRFSRTATPCATPAYVRAGSRGSLVLKCGPSPSSPDAFRVYRRSASGTFTEVPGVPAVPGVRPALPFVDRQDRLWLYSNVVVRGDADGAFRTMARVPGDSILSIAEDADGTVWMSHHDSIIQVQGDVVTTIAATHGAALAPMASGVVAAEMDGIWHLRGATRTLLARAPGGVGFRFVRSSVAVDSTGAIWAATQQHGIARVQNGQVETLRLPVAPEASIGSVFVDREDNVWLSTSAGLHRLRRPRARMLSPARGQVPANPHAVFVDSRDDVWVTGDRALVRTSLARGRTEAVAGSPPRALAEDGDGRVWLGTDADLGRREHGAFVPVRDAADMAVPQVRQFQHDGRGALWALSHRRGLYQVTPAPVRRVFDIPDADSDFVMSQGHGIWVALFPRGLMQITPGRAPRTYLAADGVEIGRVFAIAEVGDSIWFADVSALWRWRRGRWTRWTGAHGLPGDRGAREIIADGAGRLWVMTHRDILSLSVAELDAMPDGVPGPLRFVQIGALDRVVPHPGNPTSSPRVAMDRAGRLFFATVDSVAVIDPSTLTESALRPIIALESVMADRRVVDATTRGRLTEPSTLEFDYTSLSLRSPETIRFRYRLEGYDDEWVEAGGRRQATYGTLPPGPYRFHVIGSGSEGVWNDEGAAYAFEVVPLFYNTWWFRALGLVLVAGAVAGAARLRMRRVTQQLQIRFDERLAERTRIAQELHDTLLQGMLAASLRVQLASQILDDGPPAAAADQARDRLRQAVELLARVAEDGRTAVRGLRANTAVGSLVESLRQVAGEQSDARDVAFRVTVDGQVRTLTPLVAEEAGAIAREAVVNAFRYADAASIEVELVYDNSRFQCVVRDDGRGIDRHVVERGRDGHWGLTGMRERAERVGGALAIRSSGTAGTEVAFTIAGELAYAASRTHETSTAWARRWWRTPHRRDAAARDDD